MNDRSLTIKNGWDQYRFLVIPPDANSVQVEECRRAFYCGAAQVMTINSAIGEPDMDQDDGLMILENLHQEINDFATAMRSKST